MQVRKISFHFQFFVRALVVVTVVCDILVLNLHHIKTALKNVLATIYVFS